MTKALASLTDFEVETLLHDWRFQARLEQLPPAGRWLVWTYLAGRGSGKTRAGAEWVRDMVKRGYRHLALIAPTAADARAVMIEGMSGILSVSWESDVDNFGKAMGKPFYEPSKRLLTWENGAQATAYSAEKPARLRGPQHDAGWCDELAAWENRQETWDMFMFGLRIGTDPRCLVTTTPRPIPIVRELVKDEGNIITIGSTYSNRANLAPSFFTKVVKKYEGTRLGRQELLGEILDDVPGALWTRALVELCVIGAQDVFPPMARVVVAVDPSGTKGENQDDGDSIGIVVAGKGIDGLGYVIADMTCKLSPDGWGRRTVDAYNLHEADRVVAEVNYGGALVEYVIRSVDPRIPYSAVSATRGKVVRAEPVAALYEQKRVKHARGLDQLEDQMVAMTSSGYMGEGSPDRVDALVWALTDLMLGEYVIPGRVIRRGGVKFGGR